MPTEPLRAHGPRVLVPALLVVALCLLDVALTGWGLRPGGPAVEANPLGAWASGSYGVLGLLGVKLLALGTSLQLLKPLATWSPRAAAGTASFVAVGMAGVCAWNLSVLVR